MQHIARLLEIPGQSGPPSPAFAGSGVYVPKSTARAARETRTVFGLARGPGIAAPRRESVPGVIHRADERIRSPSRQQPQPRRAENKTTAGLQQLEGVSSRSKKNLKNLEFLCLFFLGPGNRLRAGCDLEKVVPGCPGLVRRRYRWN